MVQRLFDELAALLDFEPLLNRPVGKLSGGVFAVAFAMILTRGEKGRNKEGFI